jgi:hypothetical protein
MEYLHPFGTTQLPPQSLSLFLSFFSISIHDTVYSHQSEKIVVCIFFLIGFFSFVHRQWEGGLYGIALLSVMPILDTRTFHFFDPRNIVCIVPQTYEYFVYCEEYLLLLFLNEML